MSPFVLKREQYLLSSFCENFHNSCKQKKETIDKHKTTQTWNSQNIKHSFMLSNV